MTELTNKVSTLTRELSDSVASLKRSRMESDQPSGVFQLVLVCVCVSVCVCVCMCVCDGLNRRIYIVHCVCLCVYEV